MRVLTNVEQGPINTSAIRVRSSKKWNKRVWYLISNPFTYIFLGYIRY
jgi:hypothetical protein